MKKKIAMVLAVGLVLSCLQGCGSTNEPSNESEASSEQTGAEVSAGDEESESAIVLEPSNEENEPVLPHYDPTPEILEATWGDGMFQVADMVFCINNVMSEAEVRSIIEASDTEIQLTEVIRNEFLEDPKAEMQPVDKDGNVLYFFEWTWHSVDNQRYYDVAEGEEGWYLSGFYEGADIESLVGCDRDSWYIMERLRFN